MYTLKVKEKADECFRKLGKKDPLMIERVKNKLKEILENPYHYKPLKGPLKNQRRVHIGSYVLIYDICEEEKIVEVLRFKHHDKAYL